jgi:putative transposase
VGKLQSLGSSYKKELIDRDENKILSVVKQCSLISYNRSNLFYAPMVNFTKDAIKKHIEKVFEEVPSYGYMKVYHQLLEDGYSVSPNTVLAYRKELGLQAVLAVRPPNTSWADKQHPKHSYKLRDLDIVRANQVWSTDITYIKIKGGMVYMAAVIDWYSKAILSWRISNTMDTDLVMGVLNEALSLYCKPEIFNTDQCSQYTSYIDTQTLKDNGIIISMDGKGRATDNICIERFWRSAKVEKIYLHEYERMSVLKSDVSDYMEFYNYRRFHETLKYKKPMNVYHDSLKINDENYTNSSENVA